MKENDGFYTDNLEECLKNVRYKHKVQFADKILVWCGGAQFLSGILDSNSITCGGLLHLGVTWPIKHPPKVIHLLACKPAYRFV